MRRKGWLRAACFGLLALSTIGACAGRATDLTAVGNDSESHFLVQCEPGGCGAGLSCLLGVCTAACADDAQCGRWSPAASCRAATGADVTSAVCDVACNDSAECLALGTGFRCIDGACRGASAPIEGGLSRACTADSDCAAGLRCLDNACSQPCSDAADCGTPGAVCGISGQCFLPCGEPLLEQPGECSFLGAGGRCIGDTCGETLAGVCGDVGQPGAEWACYDDIAADVFRQRHGLLLTQDLCVPASGGRLGDISYRRCSDSRCANGEEGCAARGLVLESQEMPLESNQALTKTLLSARAEVRLTEPVPLHLDLVDPVERCNYSVSVRFWNIHLFDGYDYVSAYTAENARAEVPWRTWDANLLSVPAIEGGFWQVTRRLALGHAESYSNGAIIEDSEAEVLLVSGGERCRLLEQHVGVLTRSNMTGAVNGALDSWGANVSDTLDCTPCGQPDCQLACRPR